MHFLFATFKLGIYIKSAPEVHYSVDNRTLTTAATAALRYAPVNKPIFIMAPPRETSFFCFFVVVFFYLGGGGGGGRGQLHLKILNVKTLVNTPSRDQITNALIQTAHLCFKRLISLVKLEPSLAS